MKDDFEHRTVDGATAPRLAGLGPNSPFAMAAQYLGRADVAEPVPAPAAPAAPEPARRALPTQCQVLPTGALRMVIDGAEVLMSPAGARDFAIWLNSALIARGASSDA